MAIGIGHETACKLTHVDVALAAGVGGVRTRIIIRSLGSGVELCVHLHHTRVAGHVGEEHERQTASEQTGAAAETKRVVAEYIPSEAYTRREAEVGIGPLAGVDMATVVVEGFDGVVGHQVTVVVSKQVEAETISQLEVLCGLPLVLSVESEVVAVDTCGRLALAVVAVG